MKLAKFAGLILAAFGTGHASAQALPDCFQSNYDADLNLFTIRNAVKDPVNQQCIVSVGPGSRLRAGRYTIHVSNGGGGGAGGTWQGEGGKGGGGGGGAGAREILTTVNLTEGAYKLTIGAAGPGGNACVLAPFYIGGSPGWPGSPSNVVRVATGDVVAGIPGAESYARPSRAQLDRLAGPRDGHGGGGPGQTSGGRGGRGDHTTGNIQLAGAGEARRASGGVLPGGQPGGVDGRWLAGAGGGPVVSGNSASLSAFADAGVDAPTARIGGTGRTSGSVEDPETAGGGGGATTLAPGGGGGGERPGIPNRPPQKGALGSGGGGGEGSKFECDPGAPGGHGFIALRPAA
jgi:hypothetical protein